MPTDEKVADSSGDSDGSAQPAHRAHRRHRRSRGRVPATSGCPWT